MRGIIVMLLALVLSSGLAAAEEQSAVAGQEEYYVVSMRLNVEGGMDEATMAGHIAHLNEVYASGKLFMAGPFMEDDAHTGICIFLASSAEEARALAEADPTVSSGQMEILAVNQWWAAFDRPRGLTFNMNDMQTGGGGAGAAEAPALPDMAPGGSNFIEFPSIDLAATQEFYGTLFGWSFDEMDMGDGSGFAFFTAPGGLAGAFTTAYTPTQDGPVLYINCEGVGATLERVVEAGGAVALATMVLPLDMGYIAHFKDSSGNLLGLWSTSA